MEDHFLLLLVGSSHDSSFQLRLPAILAMPKVKIRLVSHKRAVIFYTIDICVFRRFISSFPRMVHEIRRAHLNVGVNQ